MKVAKTRKKGQKTLTTTIQVHKDLKDQLDILKVMGNFDDINALLVVLKNFYVNNKHISVDPKIEKLLRRINR